jgi:modulator of FtsH protease HflK
MPWGNQGGGGGGGWQGGGRGPWGRPPGGGGQGPQPPDLEELLRRTQEKFRQLLPNGNVGGAGLIIAALVAVAIWLTTGFYRVSPDEQGVELRFGRWSQTTQPGLNYHLPWPIEAALTPKVTRVNREEIGFRSGGDVFPRQRTQPDVAEESLMLTGDENIVDIDFEVQWLIKDAGQFLFNLEVPSITIKAVAESAMREVIGKNPIQRILTEGRQPIELATQQLMQTILDQYGAGVLVTLVNLQKVDPPGAVIEAFRDVQSAQADRERAQNEAESHRNDIIPRARGEVQRLIQEAEAYKQQVVATAQGDASRFLAVYNEFKVAKEVTVRRMYLETMEQVLRGTNKIIVDNPQGAGGVVPYLPLPELQRKRAQEGGKQ